MQIFISWFIAWGVSGIVIYLIAALGVEQNQVQLRTRIDKPKSLPEIVEAIIGGILLAYFVGPMWLMLPHMRETFSQGLEKIEKSLKKK